MNTEDYNRICIETPVMRPMYIMTKDVERGNKIHKAGTVLYGLDARRTFVVEGEGNISLPLSAVKFTGYGDARKVFRDTFVY